MTPRAALAVAVASLAFAAALAGCLGGGDDEPSQTESTAPTGPERDVVVADPEGVLPTALLDQFGDRTGCRVALRGDADGGDVLIAPSWQVGLLRDANVVVPLDDPVPGSDDVAEPFRDAATVEGETLGVPLVWDASALLTTAPAPDEPPLLTEQEPTLRELFEPGVLAAGLDSPLRLATAMLVVGADDPFAADVQTLRAAADLLELQGEGGALLAVDPAELPGLLRRGEVALAEGPLSLAADPASGVQATVPESGAVGWAETALLARAAPHPVCARRLLAYLLEPAVQAALADARGQGPVVPAACISLGPARCAALHGDDDVASRLRIARTPDGPAGWPAWRTRWEQVKPRG